MTMSEIWNEVAVRADKVPALSLCFILDRMRVQGEITIDQHLACLLLIEREAASLGVDARWPGDLLYLSNYVWPQDESWPRVKFAMKMADEMSRSFTERSW